MPASPSQRSTKTQTAPATLARRKSKAARLAEELGERLDLLDNVHLAALFAAAFQEIVDRRVRLSRGDVGSSPLMADDDSAGTEDQQRVLDR